MTKFQLSTAQFRYKRKHKKKVILTEIFLAGSIEMLTTFLERSYIELIDFAMTESNQKQFF